MSKLMCEVPPAVDFAALLMKHADFIIEKSLLHFKPFFSRRKYNRIVVSQMQTNLAEENIQGKHCAEEDTVAVKKFHIKRTVQSAAFYVEQFHLFRLYWYSCHKREQLVSRYFPSLRAAKSALICSSSSGCSRMRRHVAARISAPKTTALWAVSVRPASRKPCECDDVP